MPFFAKRAKKLYYKQRRMQGGSEDQGEMTDTHSWSQVESDLRYELPAEFSILESLLGHVDFWTRCEQEKINNLFDGLHTEHQRLDALLGYSIVVPQMPICPGDYHPPLPSMWGLTYHRTKA